MTTTIQPSAISGTVTAPASKSAMQRACAAALIRKGQTRLLNPGISADDEAALQIIRQLGATITPQGDAILINSEGVIPVADTIHCGESGLSVRMFTSIAATSHRSIRVTGSGSLVKRPLGFFDEVLPKLNVECNTNAGLLPMIIKGPLQPRTIEVDGSLSSQFLTGLLFAYAAAGASDVSIFVRNLSSRPYVNLTLKVMEDFGLPTPENRDNKEFYFGRAAGKLQKDGVLDYRVEADWSGAAFLLVAGAIAGGITVTGLDVFSTQADQAVLQALIQARASVSIEPGKIEVRAAPLKAFHFNATDCPDLFPPLVALASYCQGTSVIEGLHRLEHKESNRGLTLQEEFGKMGVSISFQDDLMIIRNEGRLRGAQLHSHHDHRIAMACAVAALGAEGNSSIEVSEAVNKSYPKFWEHLELLTAKAL